MNTVNDLTGLILKKAYEVHSTLGLGLLESAHEGCLCFELAECGLKVERQKVLPVVYKSIRMEAGYRLDIWVNDTVIVELKAVEVLSPIHTAQLLTYMKLSHKRYGLLINFNVKSLKEGIKRSIL